MEKKSKILTPGDPKTTSFEYVVRARLLRIEHIIDRNNERQKNYSKLSQH